MENEGVKIKHQLHLGINSTTLRTSEISSFEIGLQRSIGDSMICPNVQTGCYVQKTQFMTHCITAQKAGHLALWFVGCNLCCTKSSHVLMHAGIISINGKHFETFFHYTYPQPLASAFCSTPRSWFGKLFHHLRLGATAGWLYASTVTGENPITSIKTFWCVRCKSTLILTPSDNVFYCIPDDTN